MGCGNSSSTNVESSHTRFIIAKDYTELEGRTAGEGVKTTKAWEATMTPTMLNQRRQEFWQHFRGHSNSSVLLLKQACEADAESAKVILEMEGFVLENGTMAVCTSPRGHRYELPPFILADPVKFRDPSGQVVVKKVLKEGPINLKLRTVFTAQEEEFQLNNFELVKELKRLYLANHKEISDVRLFFGGKEMTEGKNIMSYGIESGMVVQVYKKNVEG
jgi:hypothetical protein